MQFIYLKPFAEKKVHLANAVITIPLFTNPIFFLTHIIPITNLINLNEAKSLPLLSK